MKKISLTVFKNLIKEWDPIKNSGRQPEDYTKTSKEKIWWICPKNHSYQSAIHYRTKGVNCPYCAGKKPSKENNLYSLFPKIAEEWHPTKNGTLTPKDVTKGSRKKAWWFCSKNHVYQATISERTRTKGTSCPFCAGKKASKENNLQDLFPEITKEWHPTKNGDLTPRDVTKGSQKKVWWLCPKGHTYDALIISRRRDGCPFCAGRRVSAENNLQVLYPKLSEEWDYDKNGNFTPNDVTRGSSKKVWWICPKKHSYKSAISSRTAGRGCPYCAGKKASIENSLQSVFPDIAKEWDPIKNGANTPNDCTKASSKMVWWLCPKNHSYQAKVLSRAWGSNCPYCAGQKVCNENSLLNLFPDIAKEWHATKNGDLTPNDITKGSHKKAWWLCPKGHTYEAIVKNRTKKINPSGCSYCSNQTSKPEIRILSELMLIFPNVISRKKIKGYEIDIFLADEKIGIEYDGAFYHKEKFHLEIVKNNFLKSQDIHLIRMREKPLEKIDEHDVIVNKNKLDKKDVDNLLKSIFSFVGETYHLKIEKYLLNNTFQNEGTYREYLGYLPSVLPEDSLIKSHPAIAQEWDIEKNFPLIPESFSSGSSVKIFWHCFRKHSYRASVKSRVRGTGCPYCAGKISSRENNLEVLYPKLAKEWDLVKNENLLPKDVTKGSSKKAWWLCQKGHSYESIIASRVQGNGCPYCAGKLVGEANSLETKFPEVAKEWDYSKNGLINPQNITSSSSKKIWWVCAKNHTFQAIVSDRTRGSGCPYCSGRRASENNNLKDLFPKIAQEWDHAKNGDVTPSGVTRGSSKKVWWLCPKGHSYQATITDRTRVKSTACPYCAGKRASKENNLLDMFPDVVQEWHPTKNGNLSPKDVTKGSNKKVWWRCKNGHSFKISIKNRTRKNYPLKCPKCKKMISKG